MSLVDLFHLSKEDVERYMKLIQVMKDAKRDNAVPRLLKGKTLAMIYELPSSRTRVSFANAMTLLGGQALYLKPGDIHLGKKEELRDTAKVLSGMCDGLLMRAWEHSSLEELERFSTVPVINGLTDFNHPSQGLSDLFTIMEHTNKPLEELKVVFIGDKSNVFMSLLHVCMIMNISFVQISPKRFQVETKYMKKLKEKYPNYTGTITITDKLTQLKGADVVYTDLWWWVHQEDEKFIRKEAFYGKYTVTEDMLKKTKNPDVVFMHCLPANRDLEVSSEVLDGEHSIVFDQSENRLYTEMAILFDLLYDDRDPEKVEEYKGKIMELK